MTVYVDELFTTRPNRVWKSDRACHMSADTHDELVAFARSIGLKDEWIQHAGRPTEHYDLTEFMRKRAVTMGAIEEGWRESARRFSSRVVFTGQT